MSDLTKSLVNGLYQGISYAEIVHLAKGILTDLQDSVTVSTGTWHPYGFLVIKLSENEELGEFRLHIWPMQKRTRQIPDWPVHRHPWSLHSWILCGNLTNETYKVKLEDSSILYRLYQIRYSNNLSILERTNESVSCNIISRTDYETGQDYYVATNQYHATYVQEDILTSTIVLKTNPINDPPKVVGEFDHENTYSYERRACDPSTFSFLINELRSKLEMIS